MATHIKESVRSDKYPLFPSTRSSVYLMIFLTCTLQYAARFVINMNIVCMVVPEQQQHTNDSTPEKNFTEANTNTPSSSSCQSSPSTKRDFGFQGEFQWSRAQVGYVLAAFFYPYIPMQPFAGWLADKFGIRHVLGTGILIGGILNLLTPLAARLHYGLLIALRVVMGIAMGVMFPCINSCIGKWVPQSERSTYVSLVFSGPSTGIILSSILSGFLCQFSWTIVFYILGCLTIIWYAGFIYTVYSSPDEHPRITAEEKDYIKTNAKTTEKSSVMPAKVPWRSMLTSRSVLGMCVNQFAMLWIFHTLGVGVPLYLQDVMYFNIKENGVLSSLPHFTSVLALFPIGSLCDFIHKKCITSKRALRKMSTTIHDLSGVFLIVLISYFKCDQTTEAVAMLCLLRLAMCFRSGGMVCSPSDIAPKMAGLVYGVTSFVANFAGFLSPIAIGNITANGTRVEWQRVFFLAAGIMAVGWLCFMFLVGSEEETWARVEITADEAERGQDMEMNVNLTNESNTESKDVQLALCEEQRRETRNV